MGSSVAAQASHSLTTADLARACLSADKLELDAILSPTTSMTAPKLSTDAMATGESNTALVLRLTKHIFLANLLGLPAVTVPAGLEAGTGAPLPSSASSIGFPIRIPEPIRMAMMVRSSRT
jgi:Asp-tRNA(Asn)/Glu-tRNA(Gln) amidotransferase A subunit family amidase